MVFRPFCSRFSVSEKNWLRTIETRITHFQRFAQEKSSPEGFCDERHWLGPPAESKSNLITEVLEGERTRKVACPQTGDDGLQFITTLARYPDAVSLNLAGGLREFGPHKLSYLFGAGWIYPVFKFEGLCAMTEGGDVRIADLVALRVYAPFGEPGFDNVQQNLQLESVFRFYHDLLFRLHELVPGVFEVKSRGYFFSGLIDGILDLHRIDLGNNVEGWHVITYFV